jgi:hypothetical protein
MRDVEPRQQRAVAARGAMECMHDAQQKESSPVKNRKRMEDLDLPRASGSPSRRSATWF